MVTLFFILLTSSASYSADTDTVERAPASVAGLAHCKSKHADENSNEFWNCKYGDRGDLTVSKNQ